MPRANRYEGECYVCGATVSALGGWLDAVPPHGRLRVRHAYCEKPEDPTGAVGPIAAPAVQAEKAETDLMQTLRESGLAPAMSDMLDRMDSALDAAVSRVAAETATVFNATVPAMVADLLASARPIAISIADAPTVTVKQTHKALETILLAVVAGASPMLVGPAGSGKTTLAEQIATALGRKFYMASRVTSEYKLTGYMNAAGDYVRTQFRDAYEHGGVFLFDEVDASDADALTAFNAALAGKQADFADGMVQRHPEFVAIAAGNTFGRGADRQYVGRTQLDAATLDRFQVFVVDYDEELERRLAGNDDWTGYCQRVRAVIEAEKVRHVVSPRASITGAKLLAAGMDRTLVEEACVWKGMDEGTRSRISGKVVR